MPLFSGDQSQALRTRWEAVQVSFVDEPRHAVEEADRLVSEAINSLSKGFATEREQLEQQWHRGESVSTEDLRLALRLSLIFRAPAIDLNPPRQQCARKGKAV